MFSHDTFTAIFGAVRPGELEAVAGLVRRAVREGYAIVLNEPGTKKPMCPLTAAARKKADRAVQDEALERGDHRASTLRHACGVAHALTAEDALKITGLIQRLSHIDEDGVTHTPNVGIEPGASRLLVVDVDTAAENEAFLATWRAESPDPLPFSFTVESPGVRKTTTGPDGVEQDVWVHRDGGHYWFTLPDGLVLPRTVGTLKDESGWGAAWSGRQILVPPSVRAEGPYRLVGSPTPAPQWLLDRVIMAAEARAERERMRAEKWEARQHGDHEVDPVDDWSASTPWAELLEQNEWTATGLVDTCSCPTWTAPGGHASPKSATAHDEGCSRYDSQDGHAPLHIWTDNPPDYLLDAPRTLNKLTYVAYRDHQGTKHERESSAVIALGLAVGSAPPAMEVNDPFDLDPVQNESISDPEVTQEPDQFESAAEEQPSTDDPQPVHAEVVAPEPERKTGTLRAYDSSDLDGLPDPDPLIYGLLDRGSVAILSGKFGTYKSFLALDWACHVALGLAWGTHPVDQAVPVVYIAAEGQVGVKRRVRGWRKRNLAGDHLPHGALTVIPQRVVLETDKDGKATAHLRELVELVNDRGAGLVVFDTLSKSKGKAEENSNSDMSALMALVIEVTRATKATVLLVAHTGYSGEHTRGGSSQEDDVDTVFVVKFEDPKSEDRSPTNRRVLHHRKSKDGVLSPPFVLVPVVEDLGEDSHGRAVTTLTLTTDPWEERASRTEVTQAERAGKVAELTTLILEVFKRAGTDKPPGRPTAWKALADAPERPDSADVNTFKDAHAEAVNRWSVR